MRHCPCLCPCLYFIPLPSLSLSSPASPLSQGSAYTQAEALYKAGCTYAQQTLLTAANDMKDILHEELV